MPWFDDLKTPRIKKSALSQRGSRVPEGLWIKCSECQEVLQNKFLSEHFQVCPECGFHFRLSAWQRVEQLTDTIEHGEGAVSHFEEFDSELLSNDPLEFNDLKSYPERLRLAQAKTGLSEAFLSGKAKLEGVPYFLGVFDFRFMGGSMGAVVGEKIARLFQKALKEELPVVIVSCSGGARMQEGILSLMQMARTTAVLTELKKKGIPFISVLTDPTTGGVAASFSMLGDVIVAEPKALIGFAGPRVIQQTIRQTLPKGFQKSEFLLEHGFIDRIVERKNLRNEVLQWILRLGHRTCRL
jgi:acetyl-CoA carboxylase carboxyl transferase subunit beta